MSSLLVVVVALFAIYLLVNGQKITIVQERPIEEINNGGQNISVAREPYPAAILPLLASVLLLTGLLRRKQALAWSGLAILLLFSLLFLFSSGGIFLPIAGLLLILLLLINFFQKKEK